MYIYGFVLHFATMNVATSELQHYHVTILTATLNTSKHCILFLCVCLYVCMCCCFTSKPNLQY